MFLYVHVFYTCTCCGWSFLFLTLSLLVPEMPEMEQTGELVTPATLLKFDSDQRHALSLAKKYAQEITAKHVS